MPSMRKVISLAWGFSETGGTEEESTLSGPVPVAISPADRQFRNRSVRRKSASLSIPAAARI